MTELLKHSHNRLVVATAIEQRPRVIDAIGHHFDLCFVSTVKQLEDMLHGEDSTLFHLIICSTDFDESRMFEVLDLLRHGARSNLPACIVIDAHPDSLNAGTTRAAIELMGADYISLADNGDDHHWRQILLSTVLASLERCYAKDTTP